ncbi:prostaglandin E2 receptor EP4 subtype isoform X2 [Ischnura elegans]|uniref:prostaglandin E2 receptor EP4 subtype isoform X2 n=1 Tax=Ischnura elegans TaxID=197161 RepID=UPI001ED8723E|nr:prostaglandin E2 receptor EP4 subtype isoform X2 [Ischnura elegans]
MWSTNSTPTVMDAVNVSCGDVAATSATFSSPVAHGPPGGVRHISVAGQAVITASYAIGVVGNAAALAILSRSETVRNRKQTLMLRCLAWNDLIALLGMLVQMHLTLYPPSSLYPHSPTVSLPPTGPPGFTGSSILISPPTPPGSEGGGDWGWDPSQESPSEWEDAEVDGIELADEPAPEQPTTITPSAAPEAGSSAAPAGAGQPGSGHAHRGPLPSLDTAHFLCGLRVVWRLFGLGSGCIAIVMAVERWLALTRPFLYQKHVTYNIIKRSIFSLWAAVLVLVFMPFLGFGVYFQPLTRTCVRYKMATLPKDIAYAYVFFTFGTLLCICIVCCNLAVIRVLCRVGKKGRSMVRRISRNSLKTSSYSMGVANNKAQSQKDHCEGVAIHMTPSSLPSSGSSNHSRFSNHHLLVNLSTATHEELAFARLMAVLCIGFVVCWMPQMISILISQLAPTSRGGKIFSRLADVLMALHFMLDPYIYVLLRSRRRETCSRAILKVLCRKWRSEERQPPSTPTGITDLCEGGQSQPIALQEVKPLNNCKYSKIP